MDDKVRLAAESPIRLKPPCSYPQRQVVPSSISHSFPKSGNQLGNSRAAQMRPDRISHYDIFFFLLTLNNNE
jgi:hypothetical protein